MSEAPPLRDVLLSHPIRTNETSTVAISRDLRLLQLSKLDRQTSDLYSCEQFLIALTADSASSKIALYVPSFAGTSSRSSK